jgi:hypothetical protein
LPFTQRNTQVSDDIFIVHCEGRIVFGDEGAVLRKRIRQLLTGTKKIAVNLSGEITSTAGDRAF